MKLLILLSSLLVCAVADEGKVEQKETCDFSKPRVVNCQAVINTTLELNHNVTTFINVDIKCQNDDCTAPCIAVNKEQYLTIFGSDISGSDSSRCLQVSGYILLENSRISSCTGYYYSSSQNWDSAISGEGPDSVIILSNTVVENNIATAIGVEGKLSIQNSILQNNTNSRGGSVHLSSSGSEVRISGSRFVKNTAYRGSAIYMEKGGLCEVTDSTFHSNQVSYNSNTAYGGAIFVGGSGNLQISKCKFQENIADIGGAIYVSSSGKIRISKSDYYNNTAKTTGGALSLSQSCTLDISDSEFKYNEAGTQGGAIRLDSSCTLDISDSEFNYNEAGTQGGMLYTYYQGSHTIVKTISKGNTAVQKPEGGDIHSANNADFYLDRSSFFNLALFYFTEGDTIQLINRE